MTDDSKPEDVDSKKGDLTHDSQSYKDLENKYKEVSLLYEIMGILHWDRSTVMPESSVVGRTDQLTNL